jgi:hypothetical protein
MIGPLLFTPEEAPGYTRGLRANCALFALVMCLVGVTSIYLRWLNRQHATRRVALGKSSIVRDMSLETAEEVSRIEGMQRAMREDGEGASEDTVGGKAFADLTDLENEDFVFVY